MTRQISKQDLLWEETIPGGAHWSFLMKRGTALRITDVEGGANLSALFYTGKKSWSATTWPTR